MKVKLISLGENEGDAVQIIEGALEPSVIGPLESKIIDVPEGRFEDAVVLKVKASQGAGQQIAARSVALLTDRQLAIIEAVEEVEQRFKAEGP